MGYGARLQEHFLTHAHVKFVYESAIERQFSTAEINTIISVIRKGNIDNYGETRFISLRSSFDLALTDTAKRRAIVVTQSRLLEDGKSIPDHRGRSKYVGDKWGAKYLRAPDIYHDVLHKGKDGLVRLGELGTVHRGIITGANKFFFVDTDRINEWGIEDKFLALVMTTPRESRSIEVNPGQLPYRVFMCHESQEKLAGTNALAYIKWGESQGFHRKTAPATRKLWYSLRPVEARMATNIFIGSTARTVFTPRTVFFSDNFQVIHIGGMAPEKIVYFNEFYILPTGD